MPVEVKELLARLADIEASINVCIGRGAVSAAIELAPKFDAIRAAVGRLARDAALGEKVRSMLTSGNHIPVERCIISRADVERLDATFAADAER